jgi:AAA ATPase domain
MPSRVAEGGRGAADPRRWPLVGRGEEVAFCQALLANRDGTGIVVTGAAGVGKTRLATELVRAAEDAGYEAARVTATVAGRAIPLGAFAHLLPTDADTAPTLLEHLRLGDRRSPLARMVARLRCSSTTRISSTRRQRCSSSSWRPRTRRQ